jgi:hypothetical protein
LKRHVDALTGDPSLNILSVDAGRWELRPELVNVDLWELRDALANVREADLLADLWPATDQVTRAYADHLAGELGRTWAHSHRERLRREVLDAFARTLSRLAPDEWSLRWRLLEIVQEIEPYSEWIYRQFGRAQQRAGSPLSDIEATFALLGDTLATIGARPSPETAAIFQGLLRPPSANEPGGDKLEAS